MTIAYTAQVVGTAVQTEFASDRPRHIPSKIAAQIMRLQWMRGLSEQDSGAMQNALEEILAAIMVSAAQVSSPEHMRERCAQIADERSRHCFAAAAKWPNGHAATSHRVAGLEALYISALIRALSVERSAE